MPPPSAGPAVTVPPCDSTTCWTMASPRPGPGRAASSRRAVEAVEHVREVLGRDARPVVADRHLAVRRLHLDLAPARAPLGSVVEHVGDGAEHALGHAADERLGCLRLELDPGRVQVRPLDRVLDEQVEPHVLDRVLALAVAGEVDDVGDRARSAPRAASRRRPAPSSARRRVARRARAARRSCAARSTACAARATRRPRAAAAPAATPRARAEHRVEARAQPAQLVVLGRRRRGG